MNYIGLKFSPAHIHQFLTDSEANVDDVKEFQGSLEAFNTMVFKQEKDGVLRMPQAPCTWGTWSSHRMVMRPR